MIKEKKLKTKEEKTEKRNEIAGLMGLQLRLRKVEKLHCGVWELSSRKKKNGYQPKKNLKR